MALGFENGFDGVFCLKSGFDSGCCMFLGRYLLGMKGASGFWGPEALFRA